MLDLAPDPAADFRLEDQRAGRGHALLRETFVHIAGIGAKTERRLWNSGIHSWKALRTTTLGMRAAVAQTLEESEEALENDDVDFFFTALPAADRWRAFADFGSRFAAVDIETTGMSLYDEVTVIGIEREGHYQTFIRGANLDEAAEVLDAVPGLITFNGALFDLPFLQRTFPDVKLPAAHVDLRFLGRRVGLAGPLKTVEQLAGLKRADDLNDISGYTATLLWDDYLHADVDALQQLVLYNAADTCVLRPLAELVVDRLRGRLDELRDDPSEQETLFDKPRWLRTHESRTPTYQLDPLPAVERVNGSLRVGKGRVKLPKPQTLRPAVTLTALHTRMTDADDRIVGIDLTGSEARPTGWALLEGDLVLTGVLSTDEDIVGQTLACTPRLVSIDSPLSIPSGRHCTDDSCECRQVGGITRHCERQLKRRGVNVYPCLIQSMQALTLRGIRLAARLRAEGVEVIESYPGAAQDIMRIPRKRASQERLRAGLERFGLRGIRPAGTLTHDELDAITSAVVGAFYLADAYEGLGTPDEDDLIIPQVTPELKDAVVLETTEEVPTVLALVGPDCAAAADLLGRPSVTSPYEAADGPPVLILDEFQDYVELVGKLGPKVRAFHLAAPGTRLPRRPSLFDAHDHADSEELGFSLRAWAALWRED
jgi:uncharacterized protein YprB with RNaseH-like and TPR domain/predicted nuclease with RNAse H fold